MQLVFHCLARERLLVETESLFSQKSLFHKDRENSVIDICRYLLGLPGFCVPEQRIAQQHSVIAGTQTLSQETVSFWEADRSKEKGQDLNDRLAQRMGAFIIYRINVLDSFVQCRLSCTCCLLHILYNVTSHFPIPCSVTVPALMSGDSRFALCQQVILIN